MWLIFSWGSFMPRPLRADFAGHIYDALNRGNARNKIFFKDGDFEAFERVIWEGLEKYPVDLIAYQWMSNHWHMVLSPQQDKAMSAFLGWITMTWLWSRISRPLQEFSRSRRWAFPHCLSLRRTQCDDGQYRKAFRGLPLGKSVELVWGQVGNQAF